MALQLARLISRLFLNNYAYVVCATDQAQEGWALVPLMVFLFLAVKLVHITLRRSVHR
jgi:hypothetical protein